MTASLFIPLSSLFPKPFVPKIKLRDESGMTMTRFQEGEALKKYATKLFDDERAALPPLVPVPAEFLARHRWEWAIMRIRSGKAVPAGSAQIVTWQSSTADVAHKLEAISTEMLCSSSPVIPSLWTRVQIAWLPKPGKTPSCPEHLRTIGLMGVDTKAFVILLKSEAHPYIMNMLQHTPQFAYRSGVSTLDAILRVGQHFSDVRRDIESTSTSHLSKLLGDQIPELIGGLAISLDLSKAFDCLPYAEMFEAMAHAGMPEYLIRLILQVHAQSVCEIVHGNYSSSVEMKRGLRQGCPIAPLICSAWTALLCKRLVDALGEGWDTNTITLYADDKILCWRIRSIQSLEKALNQVGIVLDLLSRAKMKVNITKSEALLLVRGRKAEEAKRRFISTRGGEDHLRVQATGNNRYFAIKSKIRYLGVIFSYGSFEHQSASFRSGQAKAAFGQLKGVLRTGACLSKADRLRVYRVCVWTVLEYGLIGVGFDRRSLDLACSTVAQHLRKLLRIYEKGVSNQKVFLMAGIDPAKLFLNRIESKLAMMSESAGTTLQAVRERLVHIRDNLNAVLEAGDSSITPHVAESAVSCPVCGLYFTSDHGLCMHIKSSHSQVHDDSRVLFVKAKHAVHGLPQCFFCLKMLSDHHSLEKHVTMGGCLVIKAALSNGQTIEQLEKDTAHYHENNPPEVPQSVRELTNEGILLKDKRPMYSASFRQLPSFSESIRKIGPRCILCGQILLDQNRVKTHWRKSHPTARRTASQEAIRICGSLKSVFRSPCQFCNSKPRTSISILLSALLCFRCVRDRRTLQRLTQSLRKLGAVQLLLPTSSLMPEPLLWLLLSVLEPHPQHLVASHSTSLLSRMD